LSRSDAQVFRDLKFERFSLEDGLSENSILAITQDSFGFMWFSTYAGVNKYDGFTFKEYQHSEDSKEMPNLLAIYRFVLNNQGMLTLSVNNQIYYYDPKTDQFLFLQGTDFQQFEQNKIQSRGFIQDQNSNYWISTYGDGVFRFNPKTNEKKHYKHIKNDPNSLAHDIVSVVYEDQYGNIWIGSEGGLDLYYPEKDIFVHFQHDPNDAQTINSNKVITIFEDSFGYLWIGTWGSGLNRFDPKKNRFRSYSHDPDDSLSLSCNIVRSIYEDSRKNLWIGTQTGGLCLLNRKNDSFYSYQYDFLNPNSIGSNTVLSIYEDKFGVLWFGTEFGGISKLDMEKNQFKHYKYNPFKKNSLNSNLVHSILVENKDSEEFIWAGTDRGVNLIHRSKGDVQYYIADLNNENSLPGNTVKSILKDHNGLYWFGTNNGVCTFQKETETFNRLKFDQLSQLNPDVFTIMEDSYNNIWIGYYSGGLIKYNQQTKQYRNFNTNSTPATANNIVNCLLEDKKGRIWIGYEFNGMNCYDPKTNQMFSFGKVPHQDVPLGKVFVLYLDTENYLWIGTSKGLKRLNLNLLDSIELSQTALDTIHIDYFSVHDGLSHQVVHSIVEDDNRNLWFATAGKLTFYDRKSETFRIYSKQDGLLSDQFLIQASDKNSNGEIFLGAIKGITVFHPDRIKTNTIPPEVVFTKFSLFNQEVQIGERINGRVLLPQSIQSTKEINLYSKENSFTIDFAALHYNSPKQNSYQYKMEGFDQDWIHTKRRHVTYTNLSEGKYEFKLNAANKDNVWNEEGISIQFKIIPPFWKTLWFRILSACVFITVLISFFMIRIKIVKKRNLELEEKVNQRTAELSVANEKLSQMDELKNDFIANVTHDFRSPLMVIINIADIAKKYGRNLSEDMQKRFDLIYNAGLKLGSTIDRLLDISKMDSQGIKLKVRKVRLRSLIEDLTDFYSSTVSTTSNIEVQARLPMSEIDNVYTDQEKLEEVLNNIISNAIKFVNMDSGKITFVLEDMGNSVAIKILDNGKGIPKEKLDSIFNRFEQIDGGMDSVYKGSGIGLAFSKQLMGYLQGKIYAESEGIGKGSQFVIELQKGKEMFDEKDLVEEIEFKETMKEKTNIKKLLSMELDQKSQSTRSFISINNTNPETEFDYKKAKIMIVDDNPHIREIMVEYLRNNGYENFIVVYDGVEGIKAAYQYLPDIIICDYNMPNMRGDEMHDQLYNNPNFKHVPFIFLSAVADKNIILERKKKGAIAYLPKPVDERELILTVELHLKKYMDFKSTFMMSTVDELTTLFNKRYIGQLLSERLAFRQYKDLSVMFLDIDHFKQFNDTYGHQLGDIVLKQVGSTIKQSLREYDRAGRFGGEEFLIFLPETPLENAIFAAEKIRKLIKAIEIKHEKQIIRISVSIGLVSLKDHADQICRVLELNDLKSVFEVEDPKTVDWDQIRETKAKIKNQLIKMADEALYRSKSSTCNQCGFSTSKDILFVDQSCPECDSESIEWGRDKITVF